MSFDILTIFGAGMLTFLTPCVLPLIPIYLAALTGGDMSQMQAGNRGKLIMKAAVFSMGFILVFSALGFGASSVGAFLGSNKLIFKAVGGLLIVLFGLKFVGVVKIPMMDRIFKADDRKVQTRFETVNAFIMGIVFAAGWSPCVGPVLGSILTYTATATSNPWMGAGYLTVYGLGFAVPLLIVAGFAELGNRLIGKLSAHLPKIERGIGILLLGVGGMLLIDASNEFSWNAAVEEQEAMAAEGRAEKISQLPIMVELYKDDCPVCEKMAPVVDSIKDQCHKKGVEVRQFNISEPENRHLVARYNLIGVPTFVFLNKKGEEQARLIGEQDEKTLKQTISAIREEPCPGVGKVAPGEIDANVKMRSRNCGI